jgi:hypothetical protein
MPFDCLFTDERVVFQREAKLGVTTVGRLWYDTSDGSLVVRGVASATTRSRRSAGSSV